MPTTPNTAVSNTDVLALPTQDQVEIYASTEFPQPFLRQLLFPAANDRVQTVAVQLNYRRYKRSLAPFIHRYQGGRILPAVPVTGQVVQLPEFGPTRNILADDALIPPTADGVFVSPDAVDYIASTVAQNWRDCEFSHSTREEWLISNLLQTGIIDLRGDEGGEFKIVFEINPPINCVNAGDPPSWDTTDVDLIPWLQTEARRLATKCGIRPDTLILGSQAGAAFMANQSVQDERQLMSYLQPTAATFDDPGVTAIGRYAGLNCFEYDGLYVGLDETGAESALDFIAPNTAILCSTYAAGSMVYGAIAVTEDSGVAIFAAKRVPISFATKGQDQWTQRVKSRYCPCPADTASWQTYSVLPTVVAPGAAQSAEQPATA